MMSHPEARKFIVFELLIYFNVVEKCNEVECQ